MNDELGAPGGARTRGMVLLFVVAIAGGAAGGAIDRWWTMRAERLNGEPAASRVRRPEGGAGESGARDEGIPYSLRSVTLTPDQIERLHALTARYRPAADSMMRGIRAGIMELNTRMQQEAMCVLSPAQRTEWLAWRKREGLSAAEGEQMLTLANSGRCPADPPKK